MPKADLGRAAALLNMSQEQYQRYLRFTRSVVWERQMAEDVLQQALEKAWERREQLRETQAFEAWLMEIIRNQAKTTRRPSKVRSAEKATVSLDRVERVLSNASDDLLETESKELIEACKARLEEDEWKIVYGKCVEGKKHREIAEELGRKEGTVRVMYSRARKKLKEYWMEYEGPGGLGV